MGTILRNPVDLSASGWQPGVIQRTLNIVGEDPGIDSIIFVFQSGFIAGSAERFGVDPKIMLEYQVNEVASASGNITVPVICNNPIPYEELAVEDLRLHVKREVEKKNIPAFLTIERTVKALKRYYDYSRFAADGEPMPAA